MRQHAEAKPAIGIGLPDHLRTVLAQTAEAMADVLVERVMQSISAIEPEPADGEQSAPEADGRRLRSQHRSRDPRPPRQPSRRELRQARPRSRDQRGGYERPKAR